jgi:hypothetical protein
MDIQITGLEQVQRRLAEAPKHIVASSFVNALDAGIKVVEEFVAGRTPVQDDDYGYFKEGGSLLAHIVTEVQLDQQLRGGVALVGFGRYGFIARMIEYGHRKVPPNPFMRQSTNAAADEALAAFQSSLIENLSVFD